MTDHAKPKEDTPHEPTLEELEAEAELEQRKDEDPDEGDPEATPA